MPLMKPLLVLALCVSVGFHWLALQSVAWAGMIVSYSRTTSLTEALARTFDGAHPCSLCKGIQKNKAADEKPATAAGTLKLDLFCTARPRPFTPRSERTRFLAVDANVSARFDEPSLPPPRAALS